MEDDGKFYGHLGHFTVFCYILWSFGIVRGNLVYFFPFWYFVRRKIWQPRWKFLTNEHLAAFCYILCTFGKVRGNLVYFSRFGFSDEEKSGNPDKN
jgi:hypothetical protein